MTATALARLPLSTCFRILPFDPRRWQGEAVEVADELLAACRQAIIQACTGAGKSIWTSCTIRRAIDAHGVAMVVVVVPSANLVTQTAATLRKYLGPDGVWVGAYFGGRKDMPPATGARVLVVCSKSLAKAGAAVQQQIEIDLLMVDEVHRDPTLVEAGLRAWPGERPQRWLGLTATPYWGVKREPVPGGYEEDLAYSYTVPQAIEDGVLVDWHEVAWSESMPDLGVDLPISMPVLDPEDVEIERRVREDMAFEIDAEQKTPAELRNARRAWVEALPREEREAVERVRSAKRQRDLLKSQAVAVRQLQAYLSHPTPGPGLISIDRLAAHQIVIDLWASKGYRVASASGGEKALRRKIDALLAGKLDALVHTDSLTEGTDIPALRWLCARPRNSAARITQEVGRVLRVDPDSGKESATIYLTEKIPILEAMGAGPVAPPDDDEGGGAAVEREIRAYKLTKVKLKEGADQLWQDLGRLQSALLAAGSLGAMGRHSYGFEVPGLPMTPGQARYLVKAIDQFREIEDRAPLPIFARRPEWIDEAREAADAAIALSAHGGAGWQGQDDDPVLFCRATASRLITICETMRRITNRELRFDFNRFRSSLAASASPH